MWITYKLIIIYWSNCFPSWFIRRKGHFQSAFRNRAGGKIFRVPWDPAIVCHIHSGFNWKPHLICLLSCCCHRRSYRCVGIGYCFIKYGIFAFNMSLINGFHRMPKHTQNNYVVGEFKLSLLALQFHFIYKL